jgi:Na+:H+ antiporter, NhaA family
MAPKPSGAGTLQILGVSCIAGIGFTMSLLVGSLAFAGARELEDASKLGVLSASLGSALLGLGVLWFSGRSPARTEEPRTV